MHLIPKPKFMMKAASLGSTQSVSAGGIGLTWNLLEMQKLRPCLRPTDLEAADPILIPRPRL